MGALSVAVAGFFAAVCGVMFQRVSDNLCGDGPAAALPVAFHRPIENRSVNAAVQRRHPLATPWEPGLVAIACNPVHLSAYYGWEHLIRMQLLLMSNPDATNEVHMTAMHVAVARGNYRAVRSLLEAGARTSMHDAHNKTALVLARRGAPKDSGAKAIAFHRTTAFLIACGVCSTEICTPAEAGGMRELEVLDARARMGSATKDERLPAGCGHKIPRVSARAALYREIHSQALADNHPAVSATAGLAASVELRRLAGAGDIDTPRATEAARQWINESISRNPNTHLWIERQRELQRAASARETLVLAKHSVTVEAISHSNPPIIIVRGLLTRLECEAVVQLAHRWETSAVSSGKIDAAIRVSETSWWHDNSHLRRSIDQRVSALVGLPVCNAESPQLVRYGRSGGHFNSHLDAPTSRVSLIGDLQRGWSQLDGERVSTVLTYLTDGYGGGGTWFPRGGPNATALSIGGDDTAALNEEMRAIMREATRVAVQPGDAVLFWNLNIDGSVNGNSEHTGSMTREGEGARGGRSAGQRQRKHVVNFWHREFNWRDFTHFL